MTRKKQTTETASDSNQIPDLSKKTSKWPSVNMLKEIKGMMTISYQVHNIYRNRNLIT